MLASFCFVLKAILCYRDLLLSNVKTLLNGGLVPHFLSMHKLFYQKRVYRNIQAQNC